MLNISKSPPSKPLLTMKFSLLCLIFLFPLQAFSEEGKTKTVLPKSGLTGQLSLSVSASAGNTNLNRLTLDLTAKYQNETPWSHLVRGYVSISETAKNRNAKEKVTKDIKRLSYKLDYDLGNKNVLLAYIGHESDKKVKLKSELTTMVGIERRKMGTENHQFMAGVGVGHIKVRYTDNTDEISAAAARVGVDYKGKITDKITLGENIIVLYSKERTMKRAISSINYAITDKASVGLSHEVSYRNKIADTAIDKKDNTTNLNFIVKF